MLAMKISPPYRSRVKVCYKHPASSNTFAMSARSFKWNNWISQRKLRRIMWDLVILMWNFKEFTPCRSASKEDFYDVTREKRFCVIQDACLEGKGTISYTFKEGNWFFCHRNYIYPEATENDGMGALYASLLANDYNAKRWDGRMSVDHYCYFSGGREGHLHC